MGLETGIDGIEIKDPSGITKDGRCVERVNSVLGRNIVCCFKNFRFEICNFAIIFVWFVSSIHFRVILCCMNWCINSLLFLEWLFCAMGYYWHSQCFFISASFLRFSTK